ncbi:transposase [Thiocapsa rosea]|uniref:DDE superfamily endonuclease n=1 Tax=Thiocapsa rosea TaxID=69360 RepID=A0A495VFM1_9GAMM|nr:transposase [Thiocapsa rosea]RKT47630.1 DDE superfamily endonuclease [Thiocapsa rosea]
MLPLPASIVSVLQPFACLFTAPTLAHLHVLLAGTLLAQGPRTVTAALRAMGLNAERRFERDHRVLNRARWSSRQVARILPGLLLGMLPAQVPIVVAVDETLERRKGARIRAKGMYRDAALHRPVSQVPCDLLGLPGLGSAHDLGRGE